MSVIDADGLSGILDELEVLQGHYVANVKKEGKSIVHLLLAECLKTHIPKELQDEVTRSNRELPQNHPGSQLAHTTGLPMSPRKAAATNDSKRPSGSQPNSHLNEIC